ncbi:MAG: ATP-binding protein, partial [Rhodanobacteraceae bacterium]
MSLELVPTLKTLHLHGMAQALDELARQDAPRYRTALPCLTTLLEAEVAERAVRSIAYQMKHARFSVYRDLAGFDFRQSPVDEALVRQLHTGTFMQAAHNVVLVGGPGTGKSHLATALGVQTITALHRRVRFFSTVELVNTLEQEKAGGKQGRLAARLAALDLVILDELGYLPF